MKKSAFLTLIIFFLSSLISGYSFSQSVSPESGEGRGFRISSDGEGLSSKITLELKGVDILDVLKVLAKKSGLNIVAGKNVRGQVTLFLQDVNVWDAFKMVLETSELAYEKKGNIIKVITEADYEAKYGRQYSDKTVSEIVTLKYTSVTTAKNFLDQIKSTVGRIIPDEATNSLVLIDTDKSISLMKKGIAAIDIPMETRVFSLKYSKAEDVEPKLSELVTPNVGIIKIDERTNKVIVIDVPSKVEQIGKIIKAFDEKPMQVLIEAKVIEVVLEDEYALGVDWNLIMERTSKSNYQFGANTLGGITIPNTSGPLSDVSSSELATFTINSTEDDFNAVLSMLEAMGKTNTLSNPRVVVLNNEEAKIAVATRQPFVSQTVVQSDNTSTTADNVEFVDVGVTLSVTPSITNDNFILMDVKPEVSTAGSPLTLTSKDSSGETYTRTVVPVVTSQEVETKVLVKSGTTIVLGGLIQNSQSEKVKKIPILGDIPLINSVFRNKSDDFKKTELVVFITPYIVSSEETTGELVKYFDKKGKLLPFNDVGGKENEYYEASCYSQSYLHINDKAFWEWDKKEGNDIVEREYAINEAIKDVPLYKENDSVNEVSGNEVGISDISLHKSEKHVPYKKNAERMNLKTKNERVDVLVKNNKNGEYSKDIYYRKLKKEIFNVMKSSPLLEGLRGRVDVAMEIYGDGYIKSVDALAYDAPSFNNRIIIALNNAAPYQKTSTKYEKKYEFSFYL